MSNIAELFVHYREEEVMKKLFSRTHFRNLSLSREAIGYQVFVRATKSESI
jgi:hypothetical protein